MVQTKHYTALFCPGGLNRQLPARMAKLYEVPISFIASLWSFFRTMSPRLTEDRAYDRTRLSREQLSLQKQKRTRGMITYCLRNVLQSSLPKITSNQILGTSGTVYTRPLLLRTWPLPRTCLPTRRGLHTRLSLTLHMTMYGIITRLAIHTRVHVNFDIPCVVCTLP